MAITVTCTDIAVIGGKIYIRWSDGQEYEFDNLSQVKDFCQASEADKDALKKLALAFFLKKSPDGSNLTLIEGHSLTLDLRAANVSQLLRYS